MKFYFVFLFLIILFFPFVLSASCSDSFENGCYLTESLKLNGTDFNFNDTYSNGSIILNTSNIILDCNGSTIYGNLTSSIGLYGTGCTNVTIKNCIFTNYTKIFDQYDHGSTYNFIFLNNSFKHLRVGLELDRQNNIVRFNDFMTTNDAIDSDCIYAEGFAADNNIFEYNTFNCASDGIHLTATSSTSENNTISHNTFRNSFLKHGINLRLTNNNIINNNTFTNMTSGIASGSGLINNTFTNNIFENITNGSSNLCGDCKAFNFYLDSGLVLNNYDNMTFKGNVINNVAFGFGMNNITNSKFENNTITNAYLYDYFIEGYGVNTINLLDNEAFIFLGSYYSSENSNLIINNVDGNVLYSNGDLFRNVGPGYNISVDSTFNASYFTLDYVLFDNLLVNYNLNENNGSKAYDVSNSKNNGTITGATWNNDGNKISLINSVDYILTGSHNKIFTLINSALNYQWLMFDNYSYLGGSGQATQSALPDPVFTYITSSSPPQPIVEQVSENIQEVADQIDQNIQEIVPSTQNVELPHGFNFGYIVLGLLLILFISAIRRFF